MTPASILVVDDEKNIRLLLQELLVEEGHRVLTADNGQIALTLIGQYPFDLILLDLKMPGRYPHGAWQRLRHHLLTIP